MSPVMLIRHAKSISNIEGEKLHKESQKSSKGLPLARWLDVYANKDLIDSKLCEEGID